MIASIFVLCVSGFCFLGQLFVGKLLPTAMAMGILGLMAGMAGISVSSGSAKHKKRAVWSAVAGLLAVAADVANYYLYLAIPGNYYGWFMFGPYAAALAFIAAAPLLIKDEGVTTDSSRA